MATTTTNFGWDIPQSTDLVKDGATAIAALGQDIDTAMVDLKGGTTGQVLSKASGTDLDFSWSTVTSGGMTVLASGSLPTGAAVLTLSSISSAYNDLRLVVRNPYPFPYATFNNDVTANIYNNVGFNLVGGTATTVGQLGAAALANWSGTVTTQQSNAQIWNIYDYASTTAFKLWDSQSIAVTSASALGFGAFKGAYRSTTQISRIDLLTGGGNFGGGTYILYGVK
jgi:hypothetical protein